MPLTIPLRGEVSHGGSHPASVPAWSFGAAFSQEGFDYTFLCPHLRLIAIYPSIFQK